MARRRGSYFIPPTVPLRVYSTPRVRSTLQLLEDRRLFHPAGALAAPRSFFTRPRLVISPAKRPTRNGAHYLRKLGLRYPSFKIGFDLPGPIARCIRRKQRREVIHAKKLQGKGAAGKKHFNLWSLIKC